MNVKTRKLITAAVIGALYAVLTMALAPVSYGPLQFRISEVLCVLPYFLPFTSWGLFSGCVIANLVSAAGIFDIVFGSLATLLACWLTAVCGKKGRGSIESQIAACASTVLCNGIIIGAVLGYVTTDIAPWENIAPYLIYFGTVALGELVVMFAVGLPLMRKLPNVKFFSELLTKFD